jgi:hypothetical protein
MKKFPPGDILPRRPLLRLAVEALEDRTVLSATLLTSTSSVDYNHDGTVDYAYTTVRPITTATSAAPCRPTTTTARDGG